MTRVACLMGLAIACLFIFACTEEPPDEILAPDADGAMASNALALERKPDKAPSIFITLPVPTGFNPAEVPPIFHVDWVAENTKSVRWIILPWGEYGGSWEAVEEYIRNNPDAPEWSEWMKYKPHKNEGTSYQTPPMNYGPWVFAVEAQNPQGDATELVQGVNMARLVVRPQESGPLLKVFNRYVGTIVTANPNTPPTIIDIPSGVPMSFALWASAEAYGAIVSGYRYAWDIADADDESQWPMDFVPFVSDVAEVPPQSFASGTHTFCAEVIDCWGYKSRVSVEVSVVPLVMDRPLLVVDDWVENSPGWAATAGGLPSDGEHDQFWLAMTSNVDGFDPSTDVIEANSGNIPSLDVLLNYKSIIWNATAAYNATTSSAINPVLRFTDPERPANVGPVQANVVALYLAAGGHVLLCGEQIMAASINRESFAPRVPAFPLMFRYELGGDQDGAYEDSQIGVRGIGEASFAYSDCCLNVLDVAYISNRIAIRRDGMHGCPVNTVRPGPQSGKDNGLRLAVPATGTYDFPALGLRPETAGPGMRYAEDVSGLNSDIYNPPYFESVCASYTEYGSRSCFEPIYNNGCLNAGSKIYGAPVAFWTSVYADHAAPGSVGARSAIWGFHPVYFNPEQVREALDIVLFDEWQLARNPIAQEARRLPRSDSR